MGICFRLTTGASSSFSESGSFSFSIYLINASVADISSIWLYSTSLMLRTGRPFLNATTLFIGLFLSKIKVNKLSNIRSGMMDKIRNNHQKDVALSLKITRKTRKFRLTMIVVKTIKPINAANFMMLAS